MPTLDQIPDLPLPKRKVANTPRTRREKGNRAERKVAEAYRHYDIDVRATRMPMSGAMTHFKGDIWKPNDYQYVDEVKCAETVKIWKWWAQAEAQADGLRIPILHVTRNNSQVLTVMDMHTYMNLRAEILQLNKRLEELTI